MNQKSLADRKEIVNGTNRKESDGAQLIELSVLLIELSQVFGPE